ANVYKGPKEFKPYIGNLRGKRDDPKLLAAEELRASAGGGLLALANEGKKEGGPGGEPQPQAINVEAGGNRTNAAPGVRVSGNAKVEGRYWAVVTGLIPVKKQTGEYQKA